MAGQRFKFAGTKQQSIRTLFSERWTRFYQRLNVLIDDPATLSYDAWSWQIGRLRHGGS